MVETLRSRLSEFIVGIRYDGLSPEVVQQAKMCLLDFLGVTLAGGKTPLISATLDVFFEMDGNPQATVVGETRKAPALNAALLNGVKGHALDMDDGHRFASCHPAVVVFPAALALSEPMGLSGQVLIEAIVAGYETLIHIAKCVNPPHLQRGFHSTATLGAFGAAAACSKILRLDRNQIENALSVAGLCGGGLLEVLTSGQMTKPFQTARAAQAGLLAALLAQRGTLGPELIFEGRQGFFRAYGSKPMGGNDLEGLGAVFEILNVYFKLYAACRHVHPALEAVFEILKREHIDPLDIKKVVVETYSVAYELTGTSRRADTHLAAKFSLPVSVALGMVYGRAGHEQYSSECLQNPLVQVLADRVHVKVDPLKDKAYPNQRGARVRIEHGQGTATWDVALPRGEPEKPFSAAELTEKFTRNARFALRQEKVDMILQHVVNLEATSVKDLMAGLAQK